MANPERVVRSTGMVDGMRLVCQCTNMTGSSRSLWNGDDPFGYNFPTFMAQVILSILTSQFLYFLSKPLRQSKLTAQILAGIILGPAVLGRNSEFSKRIHLPGTKVAFETMASLGFMFYTFVLGLQVDARTTIKNFSKKTAVIGLSCTALPLAGGALASKILRHTINKDANIDLNMMVALNSVSAFVVVAGLLMELNFLNSEIGRLAMSISFVSDATGWMMGQVIPNTTIAMNYSIKVPLMTAASIFGFYIVMLFMARPLVIRMLGIGHPQGKKTISDGEFVAVIAILSSLAFCADCIGQHHAFASFVFGVCLPYQPPLSSVLVEKIRALVSGLLLPVFFVSGGMKANVSLVWKKSSVFVEIVIVVGYLCKFIGAFLPALYSSLPIRDASALALIMCGKGIFEIASYCMFMDLAYIDNEVFALLVINLVFFTAVCTPLVSFLYDPSRKYKSLKQLSVFSRKTADLRLLVCIHGEENVPTIINLLEASNPTHRNPISVFVIQLEAIQGLTAAILAPVNPQKVQDPSKLSTSDRIVNAFEYFQRHSQGPVAMQHYTAAAPYASMHGDICSLAGDNQMSIIILPYHKKWGFDGTVETASNSIRLVNQNVIDKAPCAVGVIVDRGHTGSGPSMRMGQACYRVAMLFLGGADDREALEYSKRMAEHPSITLSVVWLRPLGHVCRTKDEETEKSLESQLMYDFEVSSLANDKVAYREEHVNDAIGTTKVIRAMEEAVDLFLVGRRHDPKSPLTLGLTEWTENSQLGVIGGMLVSSEFQFSVLVMQQR